MTGYSDLPMEDGTTWHLPDYVVTAPDRSSRCRSCDAEILWCITVSGARAPLERDGESHFARCPDSERWRKSRSK